MGDSPSQATAGGSEDKERKQWHATAPGSSTGGRVDKGKKQGETTAHGSTSGLSMLKAGAAVAGTALLALGTWQLLSQSSTRDAEDTDDEDAVREAAMGGRVKSESVGNRHRIQLEGFEGPSSRGRLYTSPYLRSNPNFYKIMSYNVWFREDVELNQRMKALGDLIQQHSPDLICFQEVTTNIYKILMESSWWDGYQCSVPEEMAAKRSYFCMQMSKLPVKAFRCKPFSNSIMGRELCLTDADVGMGKTLVLATSHLESPCPAPPRWDQMYSKERVAQAKESIQLLSKLQNVIFCGDMNWDDVLDGAFPLTAGWVDAWMLLRPTENGWTYDTKSNPMLRGNWPLQKRLDRFVCNLQDFRMVSIDMIGLEPIPGISYRKEKKVRNEMKTLVLPVLPSDHYGLLLTIKGR